MREIKKLDVWSVTRLSILMYALMGLLFGLFFSGISLAGGLWASSIGQAPMPGWYKLIYGAGAVVVMPLFYGVLGGLMAALFAWIYNVLAARVGGIRFELGEPS